MKPFTDTLPKPLVKLRGRPLIEYPLRDLAEAGVSEFVVNLGYRGAQIREHLGDGRRLGVRIAYSDEGEQPLETGGGLLQALPLLGPEPFVVVNADVYAEIAWVPLLGRAKAMPPRELAHLILVPNPPHHPAGDFVLAGSRIIEPAPEGAARCTFGGISILHPHLFLGRKPGRFPLAPLLRAAARAQRAGGELFRGLWSDVGTPERLAQLERRLA